MMSFVESGEPRIQEIIDAARASTKCRIPQRLPVGQLKTNKPKTTPKMTNTLELQTKSENRVKDEQNANKQMHLIRPARPERDRLLPATKKLSSLPKKAIADTVLLSKSVKQVKTAPIIQKRLGRFSYNKNISELSNQQSVKKRELELQQSDMSDATHVYTVLNERESIISRNDRLMQLKINYQEQNMQFEKMKNELKDQQNRIMELYTAMRTTCDEMSVLGQKVALPPAEDLRIMDVAKLMPEQLQLYISSKQWVNKSHDGHYEKLKNSLNFDVNKLYNIAAKLVVTCEQTLCKKKEMIDWFEALKTVEKGISMNKLSKKLNEFNAENAILLGSLDNIKTEVYAELNEIVDFLRNCVNKTMALQMRTEELTYELSELNSQNIDLRKQMQKPNYLKLPTNKHRLEELEKELKEENCKKIMIQNRLTRAEGQIKIGVERVSQLEATLDQAQAQTWTLERTVQQLHEQNQKLQVDFEKELNKLTESIRENTEHLKETAHARSILQAKKEDLEKRLNELTEHYNESLKNIQNEINVNVVKVIETENKYVEEKEKKEKLEMKMESLHAQLLEAQLKNNDLTKELQDKELKLGKFMSCQNELNEIKCELNDAKIHLEQYRNKLMLQNEFVEEMEHNYKKSKSLEEKLKLNLSNKEEYVAELENKQSLLVQQLQESKNKMCLYEEELVSLKQYITQLKAEFGEFENPNELLEMINQQQNKLLEATRKNHELTEAVQNKEQKLEMDLVIISEHEQLLEERDGFIKILTEKCEVQTNDIKLLQNNLVTRVQANADLNQQLTEKNSEVESLLTILESSKNKISQFEDIILTLKNQIQNLNVQRLKDEEKISDLESRMEEYKLLHNEIESGTENPTENLDKLINILENELGMPLEPQLNSEEKIYSTNKKDGGVHKKLYKHENYDYLDGKNIICNLESETKPNKFFMANLVKKTYITANAQNKTENLIRKKAITNMEVQKWLSAPDPGLKTYNSVSVHKEKHHSLREISSASQNNKYLANIHYVVPNQFREEKKSKMFKLVTDCK